MKAKEPLSEEEFTQMIEFLHRYIETDMDQWELWSFDSSLSKVYIKISMGSDGPDKAYIDLNHLLK